MSHESCMTHGRAWVTTSHGHVFHDMALSPSSGIRGHSPQSSSSLAAMASHQHHMANSGPAVPHSGAAPVSQVNFQQPKQQMKSHMQHQQLQMFWQQQNQEMEQLNEKSSKSELLMTHLTEFKNHQLPLARIKKIMKSDEDVKKRTSGALLQRNDIAGAITRGDIFDFLVDIVPRDELKEEEMGVPWSGVGGDSVQYGGMYYPPMPTQAMHYPMTPEMMVVQPTISPNQQALYAPTQQGDMQ